MLPVTQEVASSSLVGPATPLMNARRFDILRFFHFIQLGGKREQNPRDLARHFSLRRWHRLGVPTKGQT